MTPLDELIRAHIRQQGPIDVAAFMTLALAHPRHGYYMTRDPLGAAGDFTTAPEISQLFGEMIGLWLIDMWQQLGSPQPVMLAELGPGRGTLIKDILCAFAIRPTLCDTVQIHLVETSPVLRAAQKETLSGFAPVWHDSLESLAAHAPEVPLLLVANEFLDALPIHQYVGAGRQERVIVLAGDELRFAPEGTVREESPAREATVRTVAAMLVQRRGAALFIDYGHDGAGAGDTLQAVKDHAFHPVLEDVGEADVTSHVDFSALRRAAAGEDVSVFGPVAQGAFLAALGIGLRLTMLEQSAGPAQAQMLVQGVKRLIAEGDMGTLFKVMAFCHPASLKPAGF